MSGVDERLCQLQAQIAGKQQVETALNDLLARRQTLEKKVWDLNYARISEQEDVDRLEDQSVKTRLVNFLKRVEVDEYSEYIELKAATEKHEAAKQELKELDFLIAEKQGVINRIADAEAEFERLIQEKAEMITESAGYADQGIVSLKDAIAALEERKLIFEKVKREGTRLEKQADSSLHYLVEGNTRVADCTTRTARDIERMMQSLYAEANFGALTKQLDRFLAELSDTAELLCMELSKTILQQFLDASFEKRFSESPNLDYIRDVRKAFSELWDLQKKVLKLLTCLEYELQNVEQKLEEKKLTLATKVYETKV